MEEIIDNEKDYKNYKDRTAYNNDPYEGLPLINELPIKVWNVGDNSHDILQNLSIRIDGLEGRIKELEKQVCCEHDFPTDPKWNMDMCFRCGLEKT